MIESYRNIYSKLEDIPTKYITAKQLSNLKSLGINTIYDLIYYFPRAYDDRTNIKKIGELKFNEYVVLKATVMSAVNLTVRSGKKIVKAMVSDGTGIMEILWFGMPYIKKSLKIGEEYLFIGQIKKSAVFQLINPEYKLFSGQQKVSKNEILPIYSSNKNITQNNLRKLVEKFIANFLNYFEENIPDKLIKEYKIMERKSAIKNIHYPVSMKEIEEAKRRFAIEELLILELGILKNRFIIENSNSKNYEVEGKKEKVREFLSQLTFNLTNAQKKVIKEIYDEISNGKIVNRLIQGDVGSGKTVVAMVMLIYMAENGYQGALMAPTEILANQHYLGIKERLEKIGLRVELLTSSIKGKKKNEILEGIANGEVDIVIGTHSLIEDDVIFKKLGLIVIDEQHRFGVNQRNKLREKGFLGNLLVMSATPIPRSLALSIYGDLDLSIIDELPPGRTLIKTKWIANNEDLEKMVLFRLLAFTGARKGEVLALEWADWSNNTLSINKAITRGFAGEEIGSTKTASSKRLISLDEKTKNILQEWKERNPGTRYIFENEFSKPIPSSLPRKWLLAILKDSDLRPIKIHGFRHTHASLCFDAGMTLKQVQYRLGHSDLKTTMNVYTHITKQAKDDIGERFANYIDF